MADESSDRFLLLNRLADEFAARYRQGERLSLQEYIDRHPELADDIREFFPALAEMEQVRADRDEVSAPVAAGALPPLERLGDYRIVREIGRGGMGVVYEAEQISLGRRVALKVLPKQQLVDARAKRRFEREAKAVAKLHHTNIVPVFGVGEHEGLPYYAMQFIQGLGLDEVLEELQRLPQGGQAPSPQGRQRPSGNVPPEREVTAAGGEVSATTPVSGRLSDTFSLSSSSVVLPGADPARRPGEKQPSFWQSVARLGMQVADALEHAHGQGVLHRDIKPSNLLLDTQGTVWVTDFGLAKADDQQDLTHTGDLLGTLRYLPPEAFDGKSDARSDVYSLGLTLYELVAARPAFEERDRNKLIKQVTGGEPERLDRLRPAAPRDLVTVIHKAIEREPARRYQHARELAEDLRRFLDDRPVLARRISGAERLARWARRNRDVAAALAVIGLLLLAAAVASGVAAVQFQHLANDEKKARQAAQKAEAAERWERYKANVAAAASALWVQNAPAARRYLEIAPEMHRNWEWRHLHSQLDGARAALPSDGGGVEFSADGRWLATGFQDGTVHLRDAASGRETAVLRGHAEPIVALRFSPAGSLLAWAYSDAGDKEHPAVVQVWDAATGRAVRTFRTVSYPWLLAWSADGRYLGLQVSRVEGEPFGRLVVWDIGTGAEKLLMPASGEFPGVVFRPGGRYVACTIGGTAHVGDLEAGGVALNLEGGATSLLCLAYSPDGSRLAAGFDHGENLVKLWDATTGRVINVMSGHENAVVSVVFSPDGTRLASCSLDQTVRLWDGATGQPIANLRGHTGQVKSIAFTPDGRHLLSASDDGTLRLWDGHTGDLVAVLRGHEGRVLQVVVSPDGRTLASASSDRTLRLWDTDTAARSGVLQGHTKFVYDVAFRPDGGQVASAAWDGTVRLWDPTTGRQTGMLQLPEGDNIVGAVAYHPDGRRLVSVSRKQRITIWDLTTGKALREIQALTGAWTAEARAAFNADGTLLAVGSAGGNVHLFDPASGDLLADLPAHSGEGSPEVTNVPDVAFSSDGTLLATAGFDQTVRLWDVATRAQRGILSGHTESVYAVAFSADGRLLASADKGGTVRLWDPSTFQEVGTLPHRGAVYGVTFSPDGTRLAAACADNSIRLWDVATRQEVVELRGHAMYVHAVAWSPDGTRLVSGSGDFTVRIWDSVPPAVRAQAPSSPTGPGHPGNP
jgi:WD40 repeat protein/serine/threonine protein kinase